MIKKPLYVVWRINEDPNGNWYIELKTHSRDQAIDHYKAICAQLDLSGQMGAVEIREYAASATEIIHQNGDLLFAAESPRHRFYPY